MPYIKHYPWDIKYDHIYISPKQIQCIHCDKVKKTKISFYKTSKCRCQISTAIWEIHKWRIFLWSNKWKCIKCWTTTKQDKNYLSYCLKCKTIKIWDMINNRIIMWLDWGRYKAKCRYCSIIRYISPSSKSECKCRSRKKRFDKILQEFSDISDCVPQATPSRSFEANIISITAYMKSNHISDMPVSKLLELSRLQ